MVSTRKPPTTGPAMVVTPDAAAHTPKARPRSSPSKVALMIASEVGTSTAPNAPWTSRTTISNSMVGANPHATDVAPNPASPIMNIRRRP